MEWLRATRKKTDPQAAELSQLKEELCRVSEKLVSQHVFFHSAGNRSARFWIIVTYTVARTLPSRAREITMLVKKSERARYYSGEQLPLKF